VAAEALDVVDVATGADAVVTVEGEGAEDARTMARRNGPL